MNRSKYFPLLLYSSRFMTTLSLSSWWQSCLQWDVQLLGSRSGLMSGDRLESWLEWFHSEFSFFSWMPLITFFFYSSRSRILLLLKPFLLCIMLLSVGHFSWLTFLLAASFWYSMMHDMKVSTNSKQERREMKEERKKSAIQSNHRESLSFFALLPYRVSFWIPYHTLPYQHRFLLLPFAAFMLITLFEIQPLHAAGLLILASSPGGVTSNVFTFFCDGDLSLRYEKKHESPDTVTVTQLYFQSLSITPSGHFIVILLLRWDYYFFVYPKLSSFFPNWRIPTSESFTWRPSKASLFLLLNFLFLFFFSYRFTHFFWEKELRSSIS